MSLPARAGLVVSKAALVGKLKTVSAALLLEVSVTGILVPSVAMI